MARDHAFPLPVPTSVHLSRMLDRAKGPRVSIAWLIAELGERSLIPAGAARLGEIRFQEWLGQPVLQQR